MKQDGHFLKRHALVIGIILMFLFTWPIDLSNSGLMPFHVPFIVYLFLGWGFGLASVLMTWLTEGRQAVVALLKRYLIWRVNWKWYLVPLIVPGLSVLGLLLYSLWTGTAPDFSTVYARKIFGPSANLLVFIIPFLLTDFISNGEEIGWRGYVLPRLQARYSFLISSLIVGVIWAFWHLPKYITHWSILAFAVLMMETLAKSVLQAWLYNGTRGSLLMVTLTHAAYNTAGVFLPINNTTTNTIGGAVIVILILEIIAAAIIVAAARPAQLARLGAQQAQA